MRIQSCNNGELRVVFSRNLFYFTCIFALCTDFTMDYSIGQICLLWIRVRAFDWSDSDPDVLHRNLVNSATESACWFRGSRCHKSSTSAASPLSLFWIRIRAVRLVGSGSRTTSTRSSQSCSWSRIDQTHRSLQQLLVRVQVECCHTKGSLNKENSFNFS